MAMMMRRRETMYYPPPTDPKTRRPTMKPKAAALIQENLFDMVIFCMELFKTNEMFTGGKRWGRITRFGSKLGNVTKH
jgi:hypothetical protein